MSLHHKLGLFGCCPILLLQDQRLAPNCVRVYIAVQSFEGTKDSSWANIDDIANRAGISQQAASKAISGLVEMGWLSRQRRFSKSSVYHCLCYSEAIPEFEQSGGRRNRKQPTTADGKNPRSQPNQCVNSSQPNECVNNPPNECVNNPPNECVTKSPIEKPNEKHIVTAATETVAPSYPKSTSDSRIKELIDYYFEAFKKTCGFPPTVSGGAWGKIFRRHLRVDTVDTIKAVIDEFFAYDKRTRFSIYDFDRSYDNVYGRLYTLQHEREKQNVS